MPQASSIQELAWLGELRQNGGPRYLQIADSIERALSDGHLQPGDRLPPQRSLAARLGVDLTTVTRAYDEAKRRQLVQGKGAAGTYAAAPKVELAPMLDLGMNIPPPPAGADFDDMLKRGLNQVLMRTDSDLLMSYQLGGGSQADRAAGAMWLAPMFGKLDEDHIVACPGAQCALAALILALSKPGDVILAEPAIYPGLRSAAAQLGRRVAAVEVDQHGMRPEALEQACRKHSKPHRACLVYLNPTLQNPTAHTMPAQRRREIVLAAARCGAAIIEDDPYWLLADGGEAAPPPPLAQLAPRRVHYIATLSKCLAPGLRTAFVLLPDAQVRERFLQALRALVLMPSPLAGALVTQWIHDGTAQRLLAGVREEAQARRQLAAQILAGLQFAPGGIHIWLALPDYWSPEQLARAAHAEGLAVTPSGAFDGSASPPNAIRISLGSIRERARLAGALRKLSQLLGRKPPARRAAVV
ncbi:GntR family transcriptional regulator [Massilia sp. Root351]|uniref:aminotransferase-like domain-containing protein n=1 Tax=Massilia sp. Root351 TaxID=1736522 RepID=UPI00070C854D|nr:PLP-dependent aminotransferase family protein [Massilia sp. Root351]KQV79564.1 GntR family transcriptional regulator [Massilia sp. Root351]